MKMGRHVVFHRILTTARHKQLKRVLKNILTLEVTEEMRLLQEEVYKVKVSRVYTRHTTGGAAS